jgi:putative FmdB family regulatory protein
MPTYQYACTQCGEHLEVVQKFSDEPLTECPACAGTLRKVFSPVGVVFKGSGFYKTDSRTTSKTSSSSDKTETKSSETKSSETTSSETTTTKSDSGGSGTKSSDKPASGSSSTATPGQVA